MKTSQTHTYKNKIALKYHQKILLNIIRQNHNQKNNGKILDIGCANGIFLKKFSEEFKNYHLTGIDTSSKMINLAKKKKINFKFKKIILPLNLKKKNNPIISYTLKLKKKNRLILNGANIRMELFYLIVKKR